MSRANPKRLGYVGKVPGGRRSNEWFTPVSYVDAARLVLKGIELDPFSCKEANEQVVKATTFFTEKGSALTRPWGNPRSVFMNPPYGHGLCGQAIGKFCEQYDQGAVKTAIILVNNATETTWFQELLRRATAVCFTNHRIAFWNTDGKAVSGNTRGQVFFYFGTNAAEFVQEFGKFGFSTVLKGDQ